MELRLNILCDLLFSGKYWSNNCFNNFVAGRVESNYVNFLIIVTPVLYPATISPVVTFVAFFV